MIRPFVEADRSSVISLWERCDLTRPWNDPDLDIDRKIRHDASGFLVWVEGTSVVGSVMCGYDGHRGWINYLAVDPDHRRRGIARQLMEACERRLGDLGCPKVNLQIRAENERATAFYASIGYDTDDVISLGRRLTTD